MGIDKDSGRSVLLTATMRRICSLCLQEYVYHNVKKYPHGLQLCGHCTDVLADMMCQCSSAVSIFKHR
jgi:hypothetical protein